MNDFCCLLLSERTQCCSNNKKVVCCCLFSLLGEVKVESSTGAAESHFSEEPQQKQNNPHSEGERGQTVLRRFWSQMRGSDILCFNDNPSFPPTLLHTPTLTNTRLLPVTVTLRLCVWSDRLECPRCVVQAAGVCVPHRSPTWWHRAANCQGGGGKKP